MTAASPIQILLLEDSAIDADLIDQHLRRSKVAARIERVWDRPSFEDALTKQTWDIVLADYTLPSFDGLSALRIARQRFPTLPFVIVSATLEEEAATLAMREGASDFLVKGRMSRLPVVIKRALDEADEKNRRQQAERRLEDINADLERQVDARTTERDRIWRVSQDLFAVFGPNGEVISANPAWRTLLGQNPSLVEGRLVTELMHSEDRDRTIVDVDLSRQGSVSSEVEVRMRHGDGTYRWISWRAGASEDGRIFAVGRDVTNARQMAETIARAEEQLRQAQKMEAIGQLTGGVAHDFNNLLTVIVGNLEYLQRNAGRSLSDKGREAVENAMRGAQRAAKLTGSLLAFSRRQALDPRQVHVNDLVAGMSDLLSRTISEKIALQTRFAEDLWWTEADANQLENAILNLAVNARDAMDNGGEIMISTENAVLDEIVSGEAGIEPGDYVLIRVTDTGPGMDKATLQQVFDPFFTTKDFGKGTGLGLSQVYGFVRQSGGHVSIDSTPGRGTQVSIYLPRLADERVVEPASDPVPSSAVATRGSETVLLVEDEPDVRSYTKSILEELGYSVIEAEDGPRALAIVADNTRFDVLLSDIGLPNGMNGRELADAIREGRPDLRVLFLSGYASDVIVREGKLGEGVNLLRKPFTFDELAGRLRDIADKDSRPRRILLVEDEELIRMTVADALTDRGFVVEEARSAQEAVERLRELDGSIDAAVIDLGLPDRTGDVLAREIREVRPDVAIVMASGRSESEMRERMHDQPRVGFVGKPYEMDSLATMVERLCNDT